MKSWKLWLDFIKCAIGFMLLFDETPMKLTRLAVTLVTKLDYILLCVFLRGVRIVRMFNFLVNYNMGANSIILFIGDSL